MIGSTNDVLGFASLGASTFLASAHPSESCGSNGLPLTPNSVRILGRAQLLYTVSHPHLCSYVAVQRGKHERLIVVQEYYKYNVLAAWKENKEFRNEKRLIKLMYEVLQGLIYLNKLGIASCCNVCPRSILIDPFGQAKLYSYGLHHMTEQGAAISFPIGTEYSAPEVLISGACSELRPGGGGGNPASDVWSLALMLLQLLLTKHDTSGRCAPLDISIATVLLLAADSDYEDLASAIVEQKPQLMNEFKSLSEETQDLLRSCLKFSPESRPSPCKLLEHPAFSGLALTGPIDPTPTPFPRSSIASPRRKFSPPSEMLANYPLPEECMKRDSNGVKNSLGCLRERSLREVYHLWQLAGGQPEQELVKHGFIITRPPILTLPSIATVEGEVLGGQFHRLQQQQPSHATLALSLAGLESRLAHIPPATYYPLIMQHENNTDDFEARKLPLVIREKDVEYQLHRIILFHRLLRAYPYYRSRIEADARMDVPPFYRGEVWAALLGVDGDTISTYAEIDKVTPTSTDRQIEVDIPRCHQYDELLSSPRAHAKFTRLLKAWVVSHPGLVYWQGLDSLTAPFLYLNFNNEPLAYACLTAFIDKYLYKFFLRDNSAVIQEYLAKFSHLVAFHDPLLFSHLASIGFVPELYAIPWFLTMYTHVFPLSQIFHVWDTLLLHPASLALCVAAAILRHLRHQLLNYSFNDCILLFSDMPDINIEQIVKESVELHRQTPTSLLYRHHAPPTVEREHRETSSDGLSDMRSITLGEQRSEVSGRVSGAEVLVLNDTQPGSLLVIDTRPHHLFQTGSLINAWNVPGDVWVREGDSPGGSEEGGGALQSALDQAKERATNKTVVVMGTKAAHHVTVQVCEQLVEAGVERVASLHGGVEVFQTTGQLVVPSPGAS